MEWKQVQEKKDLRTFYLRKEVWPITWRLMKADLEPETLVLPEVTGYIAYMEKTYIPTTLPIQKNV